MSQKEKQNATALENQEWIDSLTWIIENKSTKRAGELLEILQNEAKKHQVALPQALSSPYQNTISSDQEEDYPGDEELEEKILAYIIYLSCFKTSVLHAVLVRTHTRQQER